MKNTGRHNPHLNALQGVSRLPVRGASPHRQAPMAPHAAQGPIVPAGEFHEAATGRIAIHSARSRPGRWILLWPISLWNGIITKVSGKDIKAFLFHSVMIHREWSSKEPISFPLVRQNESCRREWKRYQGYSFPLNHDSWGVVKQRAVILPTLAAERKRCERKWNMARKK